MAEGEKTDEVVLKVDMHCEGCKARVRRSLAGFPGLEDICINMEEQKVTIKGKIDARKAYETVKRKSRRKTELLSPKLICTKHDCKKQEKKIEEKKEEEALETTAAFKVKMHCGGCAKEVKKAIERMDRTWEVNANLSEEKVVVKGRGLNPQKILDRVARKTGKTMEYLSPPPPQIIVPVPVSPVSPTQRTPTQGTPTQRTPTQGTPTQGKEKKEEGKKKAQKKEDENLENLKPKGESKPAEKQDMKKDDKKGDRKDDKKDDKKEIEQEKKVPEASKEKKKADMVEKLPKELTQEEKKTEEKGEEKREEKKEEKKEISTSPPVKKAQNEKQAMEMEEMETMITTEEVMRKCEYNNSRSIHEFAYSAPQMFSDENPNACSIM